MIDELKKINFNEITSDEIDNLQKKMIELDELTLKDSVLYLIDTVISTDNDIPPTIRRLFNTDVLAKCLSDIYNEEIKNN